MGSDPKVFVKSGPASAFDMFDAEADGLRELAATNAIRVPNVIEVGVDGNVAFIRLERIDFEKASETTERLLGEQLASLHRCTADNFGWHRDNTIGLTPQKNSRTSDWSAFFSEHRLKFQLELASANGFEGELQTVGRELCDRLPELFTHYTPVASLLHGDLWAGNWGVTNGQPIIFDPAVYYGDRESDIAMTRLFGGFGRAFYDAYESAWPFESGHGPRNDVYQLYHVLNHLNLFGGVYLDQSLRILRVLSTSIRN